MLRIEEGFERLGVRGELRRSEFRTGFLNAVVGAPVPEDLAEALFSGFDTNSTGTVTVHEFVCGFAVLRHGTPEEKLRLLFNVYDADRDQRLSDRDLKRFAQALGDSRAATRERAIDGALKSLNAEGVSVNFKRFSEWARKHIDSPLVSWLYDIEQRLAEELGDPGLRCQQRLSSAPSPSASSSSPSPSIFPLGSQVEVATMTWSPEDEEQCRALAAEVDVQDFELVFELRCAWRALVADSRFGVVDAATWEAAVPSLPPELRGRLFRVMDRSHSGTLSAPKWVQGLATCLAGDRAAQRALGFRLFAEAASPSSSAPVVNAKGAEELRRLAASAGRLFVRHLSDGPGDRDREASGEGPRFDPPSRINSLPLPAEGLTEERFLASAWPLAAEAVVAALGGLLRVDLRLPPRDPSEEQALVERMNSPFDPEHPGDRGSTWYLISARWWDKWYDLDARSPELPSIDNTALVDDRGSLRIGLSEGTDYLVIPPSVWRALRAWYGGPGPELPRHVIEVAGRRELEMYPLRLHVCRTDRDGQELLLDRMLEASCAATLGEVREKAAALHGILVPAGGGILHRSGPQMEWAEAEEGETLHALGFIDGHCILLQLEGKGASSPIVSVIGQGRSHAVVGLQNLGNTCYMNSALQCLLHTPLLPRFFDKDYLLDLNTSSSWGTGGKLAVAFSELTASVASAQERGALVLAPRAFVRVVTEIMHEFAGWAQQDAQEFLSVFLSGLSDDVNRAKEKPYVERPDAEGRPDVAVARETWAAHCRRERSAVAALFSGQLKSVLRCAVCGREAATFDPFMSLQVPLPVQNLRWQTCTLVAAPRSGAAASAGATAAAGATASSGTGLGRHTVRLAARVPKAGRVSDLAAAAGAAAGLKASELVVAEVVDNYVFKILKATAPLATMREDLRPTIFHVPPVEAPPSPRRAPALALAPQQLAPAVGLEQGAAAGASAQAGGAAAAGVAPSALIHFVHRRLRKVQEYFLSPYRPEVFGTPLLTRLPSDCAPAELYAAAWRLVRHLVPELECSEGAWPFAVSAVKRDGTSCASCSWRKGCLGCEVPKERCGGGSEGAAGVAKWVDFAVTRTFSIDWEAAVLKQHYKEKIAAHIHVDASVELAQQERKKPEDLIRCLDELTQEESLGSSRHCRTCSRKAGEYRETQHRKQIRIWGCPPLLLLQLNRFHSRRGVSWKVHTFVDFPSTLDLRGHLAAGPMQEDLSKEQLGFRLGQLTMAQQRLAEVLGTPGPLVVTKLGCGPESDRIEVTLPSGAKQVCKPEQLEAIVGEEAADAEVLHTLSRATTAYELYAVVNHIGGMGSGHYTAYVKTRSGGWLACSDDRVLPINREDVVTAHAYLLFYARKDVADGKVELTDLFPAPAPGTQPADPDAVKKSIRKSRCFPPASITKLGLQADSVASDGTSDGETMSEFSSELPPSPLSWPPSVLGGLGLARTLGGGDGGTSATSSVARQRLECENGHLIVKRKWRVKWHQHWLHATYCALCQQRIRRECVRWRCRFHCSYDICGDCYSRRRRAANFRPGSHRTSGKLGQELAGHSGVNSSPPQTLAEVG